MIIAIVFLCLLVLLSIWPKIFFLLFFFHSILMIMIMAVVWLNHNQYCLQIMMIIILWCYYQRNHHHHHHRYILINEEKFTSIALGIGTSFFQFMWQPKKNSCTFIELMMMVFFPWLMLSIIVNSWWSSWWSWSWW